MEPLQNNTAETVFIRGNNFETRMQIKENGTFADTLRIQEDGFYDMYVGRERTGIYLEKGKNLSVNLNADEFDETLKYSGDLANINNFLAAKYLWNEKNLDFKEVFSMDEENFLKQLNNNQTRIDSLYSVSKISDDNFKNKLAEEDKYTRAVMLENYKDAHRYYSGEQNFRVSSNFYDELKNINYKDTLAYRNSVAYQSLLDAHFTGW